MDDALPVLPEPIGHLHSDGDFCVERQVESPVFWPVSMFTDEQMRAYARAAVAADRAARWISVDERLPRAGDDDDGYTWVQTWHPSTGLRVMTFVHSRFGRYWADGSTAKPAPPTHWQPLPEPPTPKEGQTL